MIDTIQSEEALLVPSEKPVQLVFVQDNDLIHVGGGSATAYF